MFPKCSTPDYECDGVISSVSQQMHRPRVRGITDMMRSQKICFALLLALSVPCVLVQGEADGLLQSVTNVWEDILASAAKVTLAEIERQQATGNRPTRVVESVPLDTLQVFVGRSHHLAVEVDGTSYEVTLGSEDRKRLPHGEFKHGDAASAGRVEAISGSSSGGGGHDLVPHDWWAQQEHRLSLPEVTLTGPLELVLPEPQPLSVFLPHAADVGLVRRVLLASGATVRLAHLRAITLRRPVELPNLPGQYLAEVYAQAQLGEPEKGFHYAPGVLFMSKKLQEMAYNASGKGLPILSFEVEPASHGSLCITAAEAHPGSGAAAPRLKVKRGKDASIELSVRPGQVAEPGLGLHSLTHVWAWPLPHHDMSSWLPYESLLRGILSTHPFKVDKVVSQGIPLKLTKSSIKGVSMMSFEMHVRSSLEIPNLPEDYPMPRHETPLEVWEVMVQILDQEEVNVRSAAASPKGEAAPRFKYMPMSVRRKAVFGNTMTVSEGAMNMMLLGNSSVPLGYESHDMGLARYAN